MEQVVNLTDHEITNIIEMTALAIW